jgi:hypothetical protein
MAYPIGLGQKLLEIDFPGKYRDEDFIQQFSGTFGKELEQLDRWIQFSSTEDLLNVLNGSLLYPFEGVLAQWFARTASGVYLNWWENMLGISTDTTLTNAQRRSNIRARMSQRTATPTVDYIVAQVQQYVAVASITDHPSTYSFTITIVSPHATLPTVIQNQIIAAVAAAKPAHLNYNIVFTEMDWASLGNRDWASIGNEDWNTFA